MDLKYCVIYYGRQSLTALAIYEYSRSSTSCLMNEVIISIPNFKLTP
jgi:hypothetical protein